MGAEMIMLLRAAAVGVGATVLMDLWVLVLKRAFGVPSLSYCLVGRWLLHMPTTFRHAGIATAPARHGECTVGWIAHYVTGVVFAVGLVALTPGWLARPTLWPALAFGVGTVLLPFLVMQPAFGLGIAASKTADPTRARLKSLTTHGIFGLGLYASAIGVSYVVGIHA
jgi:hypothetical protein